MLTVLLISAGAVISPSGFYLRKLALYMVATIKVNPAWLPRPPPPSVVQTPVTAVAHTTSHWRDETISDQQRENNWWREIKWFGESEEC